MPTTPVHNTNQERTITTTQIRTESSRHSTKASSKSSSRPQFPAVSTPPSSSTSTHNNTMSANTTSSAGSSPSEMTYYISPNFQGLDTSACEVNAWAQPIIIEDDDLTFGGKSLSAWYEEDRRRLSHSDGEEARRGRERVRRSHTSKGGRN